jgi:GGDEF domain-containing protein
MIEYDQQLLVRALDAATNPVLITERTGCIVWINKAFRLLSGYSKSELVGKTPHLLSSGRALGHKLIAAIDQPLMIDKHRIETRISVGISLFPADGVSAEALLERADNAMYQAKKTGGNACRFSGLTPSTDG